MTRLEELERARAKLALIDKERTFNKASFFTAYPKQQDFFMMGATISERLLMAGNQLGKTYAGAAEDAEISKQL